MTDSPLAPLIADMAAWVEAQTAAFIRQVMPDGRMPAFLAGSATSPNDAMGLAKNLAWLERRGITSVAGLPSREIVRGLLRAVDGAGMETFNSFQLSELLLRYGGFTGNPLLAGFTQAELDNLADGCDSSHIRLQNGKVLGGRPSNYWAVLARCELGRLRLGLTADRGLYEECVKRVRGVVQANPAGFFDDHREGQGRYDIYSGEVLWFLEPLWADLRRDPAAAKRLDEMLCNGVELIERLAMRGGTSFAWGRSLNGHSQAMLMETMAQAIARGWARDPAAALVLVRDAYAAVRGLVDGGVATVHRDRGIERYRASWRLFETSVDLVGKVAYAADALHEAVAAGHGAIPAAAADAAYPEQDRWTALDGHGAGVWTYRRGDVAFQLPVVAINDPSSYLPFPHAPGLFENACDNFHLSGAPRLLLNGWQFTTGSRPAAVRKIPDGLEVAWDRFVPADEVPYSGAMVPWTPTRIGERPCLAGSRVTEFRVRGRSLRIEERWRFDDLPQAIQLDVAEAAAPFTITVDGDVGVVQTVVPVQGLYEWRSVWGGIRRLHQLAITPRREIVMAWTIAW